MKKIKRHFKFILVFSIVIFINLHLTSLAFELEEETDYVWLEEEITSASINKTDEPKLNSRCAVVYDRNSKSVIYGKNENKRVPMASTTKIMTAIVLLENLGVKNELSLDTEIEVCKEAGAIRRFKARTKKRR